MPLSLQEFLALPKPHIFGWATASGLLLSWAAGFSGESCLPGPLQHSTQMVPGKAIGTHKLLSCLGVMVWMINATPSLGHVNTCFAVGDAIWVVFRTCSLVRKRMPLGQGIERLRPCLPWTLLVSLCCVFVVQDVNSQRLLLTSHLPPYLDGGGLLVPWNHKSK